MIIHDEYENLNLKHPFVTVGVFDGVHLGHRALLDQLVLRAKKAGGESVVITFNPHPRIVLSKKQKNHSPFQPLMKRKGFWNNPGLITL